MVFSYKIFFLSCHKYQKSPKLLLAVSYEKVPNFRDQYRSAQPCSPPQTHLTHREVDEEVLVRSHGVRRLRGDQPEDRGSGHSVDDCVGVHESLEKSDMVGNPRRLLGRHFW